jgi:hypothetical protein
MIAQFKQILPDFQYHIKDTAHVVEVVGTRSGSASGLRRSYRILLLYKDLRWGDASSRRADGGPLHQFEDMIIYKYLITYL